MAKLFGFEVRRTPKKDKKLVLAPPQKFVPTKEEKFKWISDLNISSVLDIGAHEGKTAIQFLDIFPKANIYSFEPIPECYEKLAIKTKGNSRIQTFNFAVGDSNGKVTFHQSTYSPSSSILPMAKAHEDAFPFTEGGKKVEVELITLDSFYLKNKLESPLALKIDVQGFEWQVLKGASLVLEKAKLLLIETSFVELYKDQKFFDEIYTYLINLGFSYAGSFDQLFDPNNGLPIQQDAIFLNTKL